MTCKLMIRQYEHPSPRLLKEMAEFSVIGRGNVCKKSASEQVGYMSNQVRYFCQERKETFFGGCVVCKFSPPQFWRLGFIAQAVLKFEVLLFQLPKSPCRAAKHPDVLS